MFQLEHYSEDASPWSQEPDLAKQAVAVALLNLDSKGEEDLPVPEDIEKVVIAAKMLATFRRKNALSDIGPVT